MTIEEQFTRLLERKNEKEVLPFFKNLDKKEYKALGPHIKKLTKTFLEYREVKQFGSRFSTYEQVATREQYNILALAAFFCFSEHDFKKGFFSGTVLDKLKSDSVLDWFAPTWFDSYINSFGNDAWVPGQVDYDWLMKLQEKGLVNPQKELLVKLLPALLFEREGNRWACRPEKLLKYPVTLDEHFWYLFEVESGIHTADNYLTYGTTGSEPLKELSGWIPTLRNFIATGRIDRTRLLKEAILASHKNFNKTLSGWFAELFVQLEPDKTELLLLQMELINTLNAPHSKPVNTALQALKKIASDKGFESQPFLDAAPVLLTSSTKSTVASALMMLDSIAKKESGNRSLVTRLCCQAFIHPDDELQTRAAKIIEKYGSKDDEALQNELNNYRQQMMQNARKQLNSFFSDVTEGSAESINHLDLSASSIKHPASSIQHPETSHDLSATINQKPETINPIENLDDFLFLASQAFDNNESYHIDWLPASIIRFQHELKGPALARLEPALQRALKLTKHDFRSTNGYFDHMLAIFFIDYCIDLVRIYPDDGASLKALFHQFDRQENNKTVSWLARGKDELYITGWDNHYHDPFYLPYKYFLHEILLKLRRGDDLPMLSTPTHLPGWVMPQVLVERVYLYQQNGKTPENFDCQFALSRCYLKNTSAAIELAREKLKGGWQRLLLFLLQPGVEPEGPFAEPSLWLIASLAKTPKKKYAAFEEFSYYQQPFEKYTGQHAWRSENEEYLRNEYNYQLKKSVSVKDRRKILKIDFPSMRKKEDNGLKGIFGRLWQKKETEAKVILYDYLSIKADYFSSEHNDIRRAFMMLPNNPEPFLAKILFHCLKFPTFIGENDKRMVISVLQLLHEIWDEPGDMAHLFLATSMLSSDKTVAKIAAEIWTEHAMDGSIDHALIGRIIGLHENVEFAPMKRFTDLVLQSMFRVSDAHDKKLQVLLSNLLPELPDEPIKNLKKLLEIFSELKVVGNGIENPRLVQKLKIWNSNAGLNKITGNLLLNDAQVAISRKVNNGALGSERCFDRAEVTGSNRNLV